MKPGYELPDLDDDGVVTASSANSAMSAKLVSEGVASFSSYPACSSALRHTQRGLGTTGTVSLGLTHRIGRGGGPMNSNSFQAWLDECSVGVDGEKASSAASST